LRTLFRDAVIVTCDPRHGVLEGSMLVEDGRIAALAHRGSPEPEHDRSVSCGGRALLPGFVQSHVHGCQTLFRGAADDLLLLDWLKSRIWPLEAAHDEASIRASMRLTALEMLRGGTTAMLTMETVRHTEIAFDALADVPLRATIGKCLMDCGEGVPTALCEDPQRALDDALALAARHPDGDAAGGARLRACLAPRFALCCSEGLLRDVAAAAATHGLIVHTHCAEQREEVALVRRATGRGNLEYLDSVGFAAVRLRLAHMVHLGPDEEDRLAAGSAHVLHCPSSNLKLGSGIAPIHRYLERGIAVSLGADGAPCNNNLDALRETRLAALLQKPLFGPRALPAATALELATIAGARSLGREDEIGSLAVGKRADFLEIDVATPHAEPCGDVVSRIVYAAERSDVKRVYVDGELVVEDGKVLAMDAAEVLATARAEAKKLFSRAGLAR
jgi:5-methylthioadenosine/S-adenosylhomocysteine deaminase